jgi:hypothetical protein
MANMTSEELQIFRIQNEIRSLKMKTKTFDEVDIRGRLDRLKKTNPGMADELENQYMQVLNRRNDDQYLTAKKEHKKRY